MKICISFFSKVLELFECFRGDLNMTVYRNFVCFAHLLTLFPICLYREIPDIQKDYCYFRSFQTRTNLAIFVIQALEHAAPCQPQCSAVAQDFSIGCRPTSRKSCGYSIVVYQLMGLGKNSINARPLTGPQISIINIGIRRNR